MVPTPIEPDLARAIALYNDGRKDDAQALCDALVAREPAHPAVHQLLAVLSLDRGDPEAATRHIAVSLHARPDHPPSRRIAARACYEWGRVLRERGEPARARDAWHASLAHDPALVPAWFALALVCEDLGQPGEAQAALERVVHLQPDHVEALVNLGMLLQRRGEPAAALARYALAYRLRPDTLGRIANALASEPAGMLWLRLDDLERELTARAAGPA
jgi:tetratricopeptide (TPR) repeat protein